MKPENRPSTRASPHNVKTTRAFSECSRAGVASVGDGQTS